MGGEQAGAGGTGETAWRWLASWLPPDPQRHLFRPGDYPWPTDVYRRLDELIASIESARPIGLPAKKRAFRSERQFDNLLNLRSELLVAYRLARQGIRFCCPAFPDFHCSDPFVLGIEVTTRAKNDLELLEFRLRQLPNPKRLSIKLGGGTPTLGARLLDRVTSEAAPVLERGLGGRLEYPHANLRVSIAQALDVTIDLEEAVTAWRRQLVDCVTQLPDIVSEKSDQAAKVADGLPSPLMLMLDVSRFASFGSLIGPWFLTDTPDRLAGLLKDLDCGAFDAVAIGISNLQTNSFTGVMHRRPGLTEIAGARLDIVERALLGQA